MAIMMDRIIIAIGFGLGFGFGVGTAIIRQDRRAMQTAGASSGDASFLAIAVAKANGKKLGGPRRYVIGKDDRGNKIYGDRVVMPASARTAAAQAVWKRVNARADNIAPVIWELQAGGAKSLRAIADGLNQAGIPTARGHGKWSAVQVSRLLEVIPDKPSKRPAKALTAARESAC